MSTHLIRRESLVGLFSKKLAVGKKKDDKQTSRFSKAAQECAISMEFIVPWLQGTVSTKILDKDPKLHAGAHRAIRSSKRNSGLSALEIRYNELSIHQKIGNGSFGTVCLATYKNEYCVLKQLDAKDSVKNFFKEASIALRIQPHPNICRVLGLCRDPEYPLCLVFEYVPNGNLRDFLRGIQLNVLQIIDFCLDIASGMSHLHSQNILHCDLACRNVLVGSLNKSGCLLKIADFGMSRLCREDLFFDDKTEKFPIRWCSPELLLKRKLSKASDIWSFGVTVWEMIEGEHPYHEIPSLDDVYYAIIEGHRLPRPKKTAIPDDLYQVMEMCCNPDPILRPSFHVLCEMLQRVRRDYEIELAHKRKSR